MRRLILAVPLAALPLAGHAQGAARQDFDVRTAGELVDLCAARPDEPRGLAALNFCHGYTQGAVYVELQHANPRPFCFPNPSPPRQQTLNEFVAWARGNPARLSARPTDAFFAFLKERFPCK